MPRTRSPVPSGVPPPDGRVGSRRARSDDLAREFEPSAQAIRNWVAEADQQEGRRETKPPAAEAALSASERDGLLRLRRENRQLKLGADILSCATAWFARETEFCRRDLPVHEREPGALSRSPSWRACWASSKAGYSAWSGRPSRRGFRRTRSCFGASARSTWARARPTARRACRRSCRDQGEAHSRKRHPRRMRQAGLSGRASAAATGDDAARSGSPTGSGLGRLPLCGR